MLTIPLIKENFQTFGSSWKGQYTELFHEDICGAGASPMINTRETAKNDVLLHYYPEL